MYLFNLFQRQFLGWMMDRWVLMGSLFGGIEVLANILVSCIR